MASGTEQQTALQAWQTALFAQIDAAAQSLNVQTLDVLYRTVARRCEERLDDAMGADADLMRPTSEGGA
jgi:hypothetical protein